MTTDPTQNFTPTTSLVEDIPQTLYRRIAWRILPLVAVCYAIAIMDRVNVGYASLTMNADIGLSATAYGLGAGIFFLAYCLLEVPSNLLLERFGARIWISRIMLTWGIIVILTSFVQNTGQFYLARVLLGAAEAGFYPGMIYFLSIWFPRMRLSRALAVLTIAGPIGNIVVGPISGWILQATHGTGGIAGWRWLFIIEGIPAVIAGILFFIIMSDSPRKAKWLAPNDRKTLLTALGTTETAKSSTATTKQRLASGLGSGRAWAVALLLGANYLGVYGVIFWLPTLVKNTGVDNTLTIGFLSAIPWCVAILVTILVGRFADRTQRHRGTFAIGMLIAVVGLLVSVYSQGATSLTIIGLSIATAAFSATGPLVWVIANRRLKASVGVAAAFGLINSVASVGSFLGPYALGLGTDLTGSTQIATVIIAVVVALGGIGVLFLHRDNGPGKKATEEVQESQ